MAIQRAGYTGMAPVTAVQYLLQWETLGRNRDKPREEALSDPSPLILYKLEAN